MLVFSMNMNMDWREGLSVRDVCSVAIPIGVLENMQFIIAPSVCAQEAMLRLLVERATHLVRPERLAPPGSSFEVLL